MVGGVDALAVPSNPWSVFRGYFSPATLFLLLNVVIGTIALTSRSHRHHHRDEDHHHHQHYQQYAPPPPPAPLARTSSVMERLRSLGLYRFRSGDFPPEYNHHLSAAAEHGASDGSSGHHAQCYNRSRSEPAAVRGNNKKEEAVVCRAVKKSTTSEAKRLERAPAQAASKVQRAPPRAPARAVEEEDAVAVSVDARADDFINRFRQQLQLQRLNSLLNYKEMLNRGL
uniref:DUF4408 domain-containing protein n=1 Tax=Arundo donax TaxID=35708 RepID=A0A0A8Z6C5_ARUDO